MRKNKRGYDETTAAERWHGEREEKWVRRAGGRDEGHGESGVIREREDG